MSKERYNIYDILQKYRGEIIKVKLDCKLEKLKEIISDYGRMSVALSGGVDSIFLTAFAYKIWGDDRIAALTATGPHFAPDEALYAGYFCDRLGINHKLLNADFIIPTIENNPPDRCYHCKKAIFSMLKAKANIIDSVLADGTNADDMNDYRPGYKALCELGIASPLKEAGLTKEEIRHALKSLASENKAFEKAFTVDSADNNHMMIWEKPAFACLASRIPYGEAVTPEKLASIYKAETFLRSLGFSQVRVRHHGDTARIEVLPRDRSRFYSEDFMDMVNDAIKSCGFKFASLDLGGYKMGNLNKFTK